MEEDIYIRITSPKHQKPVKKARADIGTPSPILYTTTAQHRPEGRFFHMGQLPVISETPLPKLLSVQDSLPTQPAHYHYTNRVIVNSTIKTKAVRNPPKCISQS